MADLTRERIAELTKCLRGSLGTGESLNYDDTMALLDMAAGQAEAQSRIRTLEAELAQNRQDFRALWSELRRIVRVFETTPAPSPVEPPGSAGEKDSEVMVAPRRLVRVADCPGCKGTGRDGLNQCRYCCGAMKVYVNVERHDQKAEATEGGTGSADEAERPSVASHPRGEVAAPSVGDGAGEQAPGGTVTTSPPRDDDGPRRMYEHSKRLAPILGGIGELVAALLPDWENVDERNRKAWTENYNFAHAEGRQAERVEREGKVADLLSLVSLRVLPESWRMRSPQAEVAYKELVAKLRELLP